MVISFTYKVSVKWIHKNRRLPIEREYDSASTVVAVYSAPEKLNDANKRLEEKLIIEHLLEH
jgi:hypothetical protein